MTQGELPVLEPNLQVSFYYRLEGIRRLYLREGLRDTVGRLDLRQTDQDLHERVAEAALAKVAEFGLRGEQFFAVPTVLMANPFLLGYYRLLLGFSQKEFYNKGPFGRFKRLEEGGELPERLSTQVDALCRSLTSSAEHLVFSLDTLSPEIIRDLQILTIGPQLRGSENTRIGKEATAEMFELIKALVEPNLQDCTAKSLVVRNDSGRSVLIEFSADPDIRVTEKLRTSVRPTLSMEIKGGRDASNVHNRLGEAEKSHQKARNQGFREFWTIIRVDVDRATARSESPTTSQFFHLDQIAQPGSSEYRRFTELLASLIGIQGHRTS